jgi:hypothetical protein
MIEKELACQDFVELVTAYIEQHIPPEILAQCDGHLADCPPCRIYLEQMRQTIQLLGRCLDETVEPAAKQRLLDRFRDLTSG